MEHWSSEHQLVKLHYFSSPCSVSQSNVGAGDWLQARGGGGCVLAPNLLVCSVTQSQAARGHMMRTHPYNLYMITPVHRAKFM